jgi:peptide/nickel transport system permease protein
MKRSLAAEALSIAADVAARPSGLIGLSLLCFHIFLALTSPWIAPFDVTAQNPAQVLQGPSDQHWLGTDHLGRDVLSRTLQGGREALWVTALATLLAVAWGGLLGILTGLVGGRLDEVLMRLTDALLAVPWLLFILLIASVMGTSGGVLIPALAFFYGLGILRIVRGATLDIVARDYVAAARVRGETTWSIVHRELLPNIRDVLLVESAMEWSWMLLAFSSLSFLGFGVSPPIPDWGLMISDARLYLQISPWSTLAPMIALSSLIIGINLAADAFAKALGVDRAQKAPVS